MKDFHRELLDSLIKDWTVEQIDNYIAELREREDLTVAWIKHLKAVRKQKGRKISPDTGNRHGA